MVVLRCIGCYHASGTIANPRPSGSLTSREVSSWSRLVRSNDLVHLSWAQAMLAAEGIECVLADGHVSAIEGNIGAFPRRLLVAAEDPIAGAARAGGGGRAPWSMTSPAEPELTDDRLLGGRLRFQQPARGYRVAIDPVLLAAAVAATDGDKVLDAGAGTAAAALCLASRVRDLPADGPGA